MQAYSPAAGYGTCGALKIAEVLDQIYCHHGYYTRFTSTDLAAIKVVLFQLGLVTKFAHIKSVLDYVNQAIYILEELKDETYKSYDTSELSKYYQNAGYDYTDLGTFLTNMTAEIAEHEALRRGFLEKNSMITWGTFIADTYYGSGSGNNYKRSAAKITLSGTGAGSSSSIRSSRGAQESEYDYAGE